MVSEEEFISRYGKESDSVEYKAASSGIPHDFWETYSAFANTSGGTVILGVSEDQSNGKFTVTGIKSPETSMKILWDTLNNPSKVSVNLLRNEDVSVEDVDGKKVIVIHVPHAYREDKPVYLNGNMDQHTYKRNHEGDYRCRKEEVRSMMRDSYNGDPDNLPIKEIDGNDCFVSEDITRFTALLRGANHTNRLAELPSDDVLVMIGAASKEGNKLHPTRAGLLMFGRIQCILRVFPDFRLDYREETGDSRRSYRLNSDDFGSELNVFRFMTEVTERLSGKIGVPFKLDGVFCSNESEVLISVREALVNTLMHADYRGIGGISIVYDGKKITFTNPGGMRIPVEKAKAGGVSDPRNPAMMRMCLNIGPAEKEGSGISSIFRSVENNNLLDADITEESDPLRTVTILTFMPPGKVTSSVGVKILRYVSKHPNASIKEMSAKIGVSTRTISRVVGELIESGQLIRQGNNRKNIWIVSL